MNVKLVILKSLEDVIAEVKEVFFLDKIVSYVLTNPYVVSLNDAADKVWFYPYAPLSKETSITIPADWVVAVLEPKDEFKQSYEEKRSEEHTSELQSH